VRSGEAVEASTTITTSMGAGRATRSWVITSGPVDGSTDLTRDERLQPLGGFPNRRVEVTAHAHR
jgi:hypothetical protein